MVQERVYVRTGTTRQGVTVLSGCEGTTVDLEPMRAANHKIVCCARGDGNPESCVHPGRGVARVMAKANGMTGRRGVRSLRILSVRTLRLVVSEQVVGELEHPTRGRREKSLGETVRDDAKLPEHGGHAWMKSTTKEAHRGTESSGS